MRKIPLPDGTEAYVNPDQVVAILPDPGATIGRCVLVMAGLPPMAVTMPARDLDAELFPKALVT